MIEQSLREKLERGESFLVAASGGLDSMCLLYGLAQLKEELGITVEVAHVNHGLRLGAEQDEELVSEFCKAHQLPFHLKKLGEKPEKKNFEGWAREERYSYFLELLEYQNLNFVLTAHHQGDLIETLLMRILANREPRQLMELNKKNKVIRPLLQLTKAELSTYASEHGVPFREDESNLDLKYLRNKVRHSLRPFLLENFGDEVEKNLANQAKALERELSALDELSKLLLSQLGENEFGSRTWLRSLTALLEEYPAPVGERLVRDLFLPYTHSPLGRESSQQVRSFFLNGTVATQVPPGVEIRRKDGGIVVSKLLEASVAD